MTLTKNEIRGALTQYTNNNRFNIGGFIFDEEKRTLEIGGDVYRLREKIFLTFSFFAYSDGRMVHRDMLVDNIWKNNHNVGQKSLTNAVYHLRQILASDKNNSIRIITISKTGYRLVIDQN